MAAVHVLGDMEYARGCSRDRGNFAREEIANDVFCSIAVMHVNVDDSNATNNVPVYLLTASNQYG